MPGSGDLYELAFSGNYAAINAVNEDGYDHELDAPFYYGKIDGLGHIISNKDLGGVE